MQKYEIMVILKSDLDEKAATKYFQDGILAKIKELGGKTTFEDFWGSRGFAYRIKQYTWGYYAVAQFEMSREKTLELRNDLNIDNNVLRQLITVVDKNAPAPRKYADMKKEYEAAEAQLKSDQEKEEEKKPAKREKLSTVGDKKDEDKAEKAEEAPAKKEEKAEPKKDEVDEAIDKVLDDATADL